MHKNESETLGKMCKLSERILTETEFYHILLARQLSDNRQLRDVIERVVIYD